MFVFEPYTSRLGYYQYFKAVFYDLLSLGPMCYNNNKICTVHQIVFYRRASMHIGAMFCIREGDPSYLTWQKTSWWECLIAE